MPVTDGYRMVELSLKYAVFVTALIFAAFFLFETLTELRLHAVHYGLVGAALCLFYLALLAIVPAALDRRRSWKRVVGALVASLLPFGPFIFDAKVLRPEAPR